MAWSLPRRAPDTNAGKRQLLMQPAAVAPVPDLVRSRRRVYEIMRCRVGGARSGKTSRWHGNGDGCSDAGQARDKGHAGRGGLKPGIALRITGPWSSGTRSSGKGTAPRWRRLMPEVHPGAYAGDLYRGDGQGSTLYPEAQGFLMLAPTSRRDPGVSRRRGREPSRRRWRSRWGGTGRGRDRAITQVTTGVVTWELELARAADISSGC